LKHGSWGDAPTKRIGAGRVGGFSVHKTWGSFYGVEGVVEYEIEGSPCNLVINFHNDYDADYGSSAVVTCPGEYNVKLVQTHNRDVMHLDIEITNK